MMRKRIIVMTFMLSFLVFVATESHAQADAYFNGVETRRDPNSHGFSFDDFNGAQGNGFYFGGFNGSGGNGFDFDDFNGAGGNGFFFDNFTGNPDGVPLGSGLLLLTGFALLWRKRKAKSDELISIEHYKSKKSNNY